MNKLTKEQVEDKVKKMAHAFADLMKYIQKKDRIQCPECGLPCVLKNGHWICLDCKSGYVKINKIKNGSTNSI